MEGQDMNAFGNFDEGADGWMASQAAPSDGAQMMAQTAAPMGGMPAMGAPMGGAARSGPDDDLTEEELGIVAAAQARMDEIKQSLHAKMVEETK